MKIFRILQIYYVKFKVEVSLPIKVLKYSEARFNKIIKKMRYLIITLIFFFSKFCL